MRNGIAIAGSMIVDQIKLVKNYPNMGALTNILEVELAPGGAVCNTLSDLARLDETIKLSAVGVVGDDEAGRYILKKLSKYPNISLKNVQKIDGLHTTFTDVMTDEKSRQRTFFTYMGADGHLGVNDFDFEELECKLLHVAYAMLLKKMDSDDEEYGTHMARVLCEAQKHGIETAIDVVSVSENNDTYQKIVIPSLKYADYCIINESEAAAISDIKLRDTSTDKLILSNFEPAMRKLREYGAKKWIVIHTPEAAFGLDENENYSVSPCLRLPRDYIVGTVGAGDAFCAGVLYCANAGKSIDEAMQLGMATAAASLKSADASEGVGKLSEVLELLNKFDRQVI